MPWPEDATTLQPILARDAFSARITEMLYEPLTDWDPKTGEARPRLGRWQTADGQTYDWALADASWSDGRPVVAADFLVAVKAIGRSKKSPRQAPLTQIVGLQDFASGRTGEIEGITLDPSDPRRFRVRLARSYCPITPIFGPSLPLLPAHVFGRYLDDGAAIDTAPENDRPTVTSGPFRLKEWRRGERLVLTRNERYWRGAPYLEALEFKVSPYEMERWTDAARRGGNHFIPVAPNDAAFAESLQRVAGMRIDRSVGGSYTYIGWNTASRTVAALRDRRVRQALAFGFDMDLAIAQLAPGARRHVAHHLPGHWAHPAGLEPYAFDLDRARSLLREAGYAMGADGYYARDGKRLAFRLETNDENPLRAAFAQLAADQYRRLGVEVTAELRPFELLVERMTTTDEVEAVVVGWTLQPDADAHAIWHSSAVPDPSTKRPGNNNSRFVDPRVDAALVAGRHGPDCSKAARTAHYEVVNRVLNAEQPYNFGFIPPKIVAAPTRLRGFEIGIFLDDFFDIHKWWLAPEKK